MSFATPDIHQKIVSVIQGEYAVSDNPSVVMSTVLGSCIAACLYDKERGIGGMNHFLLPQAATGRVQDVKYGAYLMELLINNLLKKGAQRHLLRAKLSGGAKLNNFSGNVGMQNVEFARKYLGNEGIPIEWESLGGMQARRIHFNPVGGRLTERFVQSDSKIDESPRAERRPVPKADVELF